MSTHPEHRTAQSLKEDFMLYMGNVARCERELAELDFNWRIIETIAKMTCSAEAKNILPTMAQTRSGFAKLESQLVENLILETLNKVVLELSSKAQVVVDIVVRNLYERTADVGFLATDDDIRRFVLGTPDAPDAEALLARLGEYRDKYTVYDEIVILDLKGRVLAHLDPESPIEFSSDPLIRQTLATNGYLETFRATDLRPGQSRALVYSRRIDHPQTGQPIGVLCLCFRFEDEMAGIFQRLSKPGDRSVMLLLDAEDRVIASSDGYHIPLGSRLETAASGHRVVAFGGREYLAATNLTQGYQGYTGMGWRGHVMIPLTSAFLSGGADALARIDQDTLAALLGNAENFCPALADIAQSADGINRSLRRVVWNGQVMAAGGQGDRSGFKAILQQISETGDRTRRVFADSIRDLYSTVVSSLLADVGFIASLMIDIMDRNLYERANDCRWWALASDIRRILATPEADVAELAQVSAILEYINSLYTVYTRLFVYDRSGRIVAASNLHRDALNLVDERVDADYAERVFRLPTTQDYCVSAFQPTPFYNGHPTYIYNAAIRAPDDPNQIVGGIGLVFDAGPEFRNMLKAALPTKDGCFAVFVDRAGTILSSTDSAYPIGATFPMDPRFAELANGEGLSIVMDIAGTYYSAGCAMSSGYREYKRSGDYVNDIAAIVCVPLGRGARSGDAELARETIPFPVARGRQLTEFATFFIGERLYAIEAGAVLDSFDVAVLNHVDGAKRYLAGLLTLAPGSEAREEGKGIVPVIDMHYLLGVNSERSRHHIIVVRTEAGPLGLLVDELHTVHEFDAEDVERLPPLIRNDVGYIGGVIRVVQEPPTMLQILSPAKLLAAAQRLDGGDN